MSAVCGILAMLFIAVPALEIYLLIAVGTEIGALATVAVIVVTGVLGAALARQQGVAALQDLQRSLATGAQVGGAGAQAALVLVAGVLLLTPGFFTDGVGFALLMPPIRRVLATWLVARYANRAARAVVFGGMPEFPPGMPGFPPGFTRDPHGPRAHGDDDDGNGNDNSAHNGDDDPYDPPPPGVIDV